MCGVCGVQSLGQTAAERLQTAGVVLCGARLSGLFLVSASSPSGSLPEVRLYSVFVAAEFGSFTI